MSALLHREGTAPVATALVVTCLALLTIGVAFAPVLRQMISIWNTYNYQHCYLLPAIAAWLAWRDRLSIESTAKPWLPALLFVAAAGLSVTLGEIVGASIVQHLALIAMIPSVIALVLGRRILRSIAYPIGLLFLMVPLGDSLVPYLVDWTAYATVAAVSASGVPIFRVGNTFELPTGSWSVVEACSGLNYILASLLLASIYAKLTYRDGIRRLFFITTTIGLAVLANWLRAYMIVMIGHLSNMRYGTGDDHLWFGWLLYGVLMAGLFMIGSRWSNVEAPQNIAPPLSPDYRHSAARSRNVIGAGLLAIVAALIWIPPASWLKSVNSSPPDLTPIRKLVKVSHESVATLAFRPDYSGGVEKIEGVLASHPPVRVLVIRYSRQSENGEMVTSRNRVVSAEQEQTTWRIASERRVDLKDALPGSLPLRVNEYIVTRPGSRNLVWEWFVVGKTPTPSRLDAKLRTAKHVLTARGDDSMALVMWTPLESSEGAARQLLATSAAEFATRVHAEDRP